MRDAGLPVILIVLGAGWLLHSLNLLPDVHWLWIICLAGAGVGILLVEGFTKSSVISGPLLILAGFMSFCRQTYRVGWGVIIPVMLIAAGILMLVSRSPSIPESRHRLSRMSRPMGGPDEGDRHG
ncbi:LiaF transmembrane domain-containing protein [Noviherbaspirillum galbum]|uniref:LiaF transmembrane domain-containing protein n=1 Tax=Noviherbaspirillum galbum TaxID=2709383 RepID=A0A6B3SFG5_9BURK|nr:hypothetical protein [Noviherbaspirillum galbum]NEX59637.1 hypothetical protein [Noviherbaspirillum galbum]